MNKFLTSVDNNKVIITAALPYANGNIHIGHLLEYIQADIYTRFLKLIWKEAYYICASDMHGTPIEVNAAKEGVKPEVFAEKFWLEHQKDFATFLIKFDNYYKTHSSENRLLAEFFFSELKKKDLIYTKKIKVMYCAHCARSLPDRFVKGVCPNCKAEEQYGDICEKCNTVLKALDLINPFCVICKNKPEQRDSLHYFFKLSKFTDKLQAWIIADREMQQEMKNWLQGWIDKGLDDWCISRDAPYFGFEIPGSLQETGQVKYFYVWLDAPIGYISSTQNFVKRMSKDWEDYWHKGRVQHFIGKDISYFHFLFWPALLMAMEIPLPKLMVHGFITVNGQKMSKSRGTFFTAKDFAALYPVEGLRFYYASHLDRKLVDIDLSLEEFKAVNNNVLMGSLGNFCYRVLTFAEKNYGSIEKVAEEKNLNKEILELVADIESDYLNMDFKSAVKGILTIADIGNAYFQKSEVWKCKDTDDAKAKVGWCVNLARNLAVLVSPVLPKFSVKVASVFGEKELVWKNLGFKWEGKLHSVELLVQKIETIHETKSAEPSLIITPEAQQLGIKVCMAIVKNVTAANKNEKLEVLKKEIVDGNLNFLNNNILEGYKEIYKQIGIQEIPPVEHLINTVKKSNKLPNINTVVDAYNLISLKTFLSMGCHDITKIKGDLFIKITDGSERFIPLGQKDPVKISPGEYACVDEEKVLCRMDVKQGDETKITKNTKDLLIYVQGNKNTSKEYLRNALQEACELIVENCGGTYEIKTKEAFNFPLQMCVGEIKEVNNHPNADSLYLMKVDFGAARGVKQVVAGLKKFFRSDQLQGKKAVFCVNMKPAKLRGEVSEAMIMVADDGEKLGLLQVGAVNSGEEVLFEGMVFDGGEVGYDDFKKLKMEVKGKNVVFEGRTLSCNKNAVVVEGVKEGARIA